MPGSTFTHRPSRISCPELLIHTLMALCLFESVVIANIHPSPRIAAISPQDRESLLPLLGIRGPVLSYSTVVLRYRDLHIFRCRRRPPGGPATRMLADATHRASLDRCAGVRTDVSTRAPYIHLRPCSSLLTKARSHNVLPRRVIDYPPRGRV